ncbi:hypothetical protein [Nocardiopsis sp. NRRL B-16309]|uniref:hypothetical protein n=1 Tax=Nocardiopsis sp. NRRL B-16309 TaxID=1519494 RepID=UPI0012E0DA52|nr:hypothetical protein [Nocardiopsis sp. NRRL B-16309]
MIRATRPAHPHEGTVHADHLPTAHIERARADGWTITTLAHAPNLALPEEAARLWRAAIDAGAPWALTQRPPHSRTEDGLVTFLEIRDLDQSSTRPWTEWSWDPTGQAAPAWMSLQDAHRLLTDRIAARR